MHIFICGLNSTEEVFNNALYEADRIISIFTSLQGSKRFVYYNPDRNNFIISLLNLQSERSGRNYIYESDETITFFSGLPVDPEDKIKAHDAKCLSEDFDRIKTTFEGQGAIFRLHKFTGSAEIVSDSLGMEQIYYTKYSQSLILSNHISFLSGTTLNTQLDHFGMSFYLAIGWAASDKTLIHNIRVMRGAQHWVWKDKRLETSQYFFLPLLASGRGKLQSKIGEEITEAMLKRISMLSRHFEIECPLTGGFDSRVLAAVLMSLKIDADYYTSGNPASDDVRIAKQIASTYNLRHRTFQIIDETILDSWEQLVDTFISKNDGMVSLWQLADMIANTDQKQYRTVRLTAHGATTAKVIYDVANLNKTLSPFSLRQYFTDRLISNTGGFIAEAAIQTSKDYLMDYIDSRLEDGVAAEVIPNHFFVHERISRFHGNSWNKSREISDSYDIFCSPFYIQHSLSLKTYQKTTYPIHYMIFSRLNRNLISLPFSENRKFGIQNPYLYLFLFHSKEILKKTASILSVNKVSNVSRNPNAFNQAYWFKKKTDHFRSVILDQSSSELNYYIKRNVIEKVLLNPETPVKMAELHKIFLIATMFYYAQHLKKSDFRVNSGINNYKAI